VTHVKPKQFNTQLAIDHLRELAQRIGPRLAGTRGDRLAAGYIRRQFESYGLELHVQRVKFADPVWTIRLRASCLIILFISTLFLPPFPALGMLLLAAVLVFLAPKIAPRKTTYNIIGKLRCRTRPKRRLLIIAHYDSALDVSNRRFSMFMRYLGILILMIFAGAIILRTFKQPPVAWRFYWLGLAAFFLPPHVWWLFTGIRGRGTPGANDNASGLAVMLEGARAISRAPPEGVELWFVASGGEEEETVGARELVRRFPELRNRTWVLNLDMVGIGDPCIIRGSGLRRKKQSLTSSLLNRMLSEACGLCGCRAGWDWLPFARFDHNSFLEAGIPATTLTAGERGTDRLARFIGWLYRLPVGHIRRYPHAHSGRDGLDKIQPEAIERSGRILLEFVGLVERR